MLSELDVTQAQDLRGDGGADVGPHDDAALACSELEDARR